MKSSQGNINPALNSDLKEISALDLRIDSIKEYFIKNSLINENFQDEKKERLSLLKTKKSIKHYGHIPAFVIDPYSSDEESDIEDEKLNEATIRDVANYMIDLNTIMTVRNFEEFPKEARPAVLLQNVDEWITPSHIKQFVEDCPVFIKEEIQPKIEEVKILRYKNLTFALVIFQKILDCEKFFKYLDHPVKKKKAPTKNSKGTLIDAYIAYDLLDLTLSNWNGVVLRNVPNNCTQANVKSFCENHVNGVLYALNPNKIKTSYCSIVILKELDDAEKLCVAVNNKEVAKNKKIKAHIHPRSCKIRRNAERSHFLKLFMNNKVVFNKIIKDSSSLHLTSIPLTKLKIFQSTAGKVESDTPSNSVLKDTNTQIQTSHKLINLLIKSPENSKSNILPANEKVNSFTDKNLEKNIEKDMYTSLLSMLSIPSSISKSQEKEQPITDSIDQNNSKIDKKISQKDNTFQTDHQTNRNLDNKLPFINNVNSISTDENEYQQNTDSKKSGNFVSLTNKESNPSMTKKKSSNNTIQMMSNIGKMLELINKSAIQCKPPEIHSEKDSEKFPVKSQLDSDKNNKEPSQIQKENIKNNSSIIEEKKIQKNEIVITNSIINNENDDDYNQEIEEINDLYYITYDFKDLTYYERPRQRNCISKFKEFNKDNKSKISEKVENLEQSKFKKFNNSNNRINFDSNVKFANHKNYSELIDAKEKEKEISTQIYTNEIKMTNLVNQNNLIQSHYAKNNNYIKNVDRKYNSDHTHILSNNYINKFHYHNDKKILNELSEQSIYNKQTNPSIHQVENIDLTESTNVEKINLYKTNILNEQNQHISENNKAEIRTDSDTSENKINSKVSPPKEEILPPLPSTQPPEPEIRIPTSSDSVHVVESHEEPGQIILSSTDEDKNKDDKKTKSLTNSEDNEDRKYTRKKRSRSRDRYRDDYNEYKGNHRRHGNGSREYGDKGNYHRKYSKGYKGENRDGRDYYSYTRNYSEYTKDSHVRKSFKEKNRGGKHNISHSRSSSLSSKNSSDNHNEGFYMKKFVERSKYNYSSTNVPKKYHSQNAEENLDSREKHFKYK